MFDDMDGKFVCRLRSHRTSFMSSKSRGVEVTVQSSAAILDAQFDLQVLDRLHDPCFIAIRRPSSDHECYLIYEVVGVKGIHLQELGVDPAMPKVLREEFLQTIEKGWEDSKENWIDITSVPMGHLVRVSDEKIEFERTRLTPLTGTRAHLLSLKATREFVCAEKGSEIGTLLGYGLPFTVRVPDLVRYHTGVFGFTGVGKSNLVASLVRRALEFMGDLRVVIFDLSGEYIVNLLDIMDRGSILTTEPEIVEDPRALVDSQIVPETLEASLGGTEPLEKALIDLHTKGAVRKLELSLPELTDPTLSLVTNFLTRAHELGKAGAASSAALIRIEDLKRQHGLKENTPLREIIAKGSLKSELVQTLQSFRASVHQMSAEAKEADSLLDFLANPPMGTARGREEVDELTRPEDLAEAVLSEGAPKLTVVYIPDQYDARDSVARYIDRLLDVKKRGLSKVNVLTVLDEAQEFIPDRTSARDKTEDSSVAVESLLRQGRKYRAGCWLSTQRVAHLNVNALQQLHSYFASTLPRLYDRIVVADAYSLDYEVLDRLAELEIGEWLFVSYKASKMRNVPVFLRAVNNEDNLIRYLRP